MSIKTLYYFVIADGINSDIKEIDYNSLDDNLKSKIPYNLEGVLCFDKDNGDYKLFASFDIVKIDFFRAGLLYE